MRERLYRELEPTARTEVGLSTLNRLIVVLIVASVAMAVLETESTIREAFPRVFFIANATFGSLFTIEYLARLWAAGENQKYAGIMGKCKYIVSPYAVIDLLAILPFLLSIGSNNAYILRLLRLFRLIRLAKLGRYSTALQNIAVAVYERRYELIMSLFSAFIVMLFAAAALHLTEGHHNAESFGSIPRAMWWGAATLTKVGYGGAFPVTVLGKIFAAIFAIAAVGVVALPTGILAASFGVAFKREK